MNLEREASDRAAIGAIRGLQRQSIAREQRKDALDRIIDSAPGRLEQHWADALAIRVEHGEQEILLAGEEVIEAPGVDPRRTENVGDAGSGVALGREQLHRRRDNLLAVVLDTGFTPIRGAL